MFLIECPWCGPRDETEFSYGGEAHIARPVGGGHDMTNAEWGHYVFHRTNPKGLHRERWVHSHGCRRWFNVVRDTVSHEFLLIYKPGEKPDLPALPKSPEPPDGPGR